MFATQRPDGQVLNSVGRTCARLDLGKTKIYELIKNDRLKTVKIGSKTLITETSVQAFLSQLLETADGKAA